MTRNNILTLIPILLLFLLFPLDAAFSEDIKIGIEPNGFFTTLRAQSLGSHRPCCKSQLYTNWVTLGNHKCGLCFICLSYKMGLTAVPTPKAGMEVNELMCTRHLTTYRVHDNAQ